MIKELVNKYMGLDDGLLRDYIGASSVGGACDRAIWYEYKGYKSKFGEKTKMTFEIGKSIEEIVLRVLELEGGMIERPLQFKEESLPLFRGTCDAVIEIEGERVILEIKSASDSNFSKMARQTIAIANTRYWDQAQSYMGMSGIHKCIFLVVNKNTSDIYEELVAFDKFHYQSLVEKARVISKCEKEPARINESPLFYLCKMCGFKDACHGVAL